MSATVCSLGEYSFPPNPLWRITAIQMFSTFIGIDQTGASIKNGRGAKPLPVCVGHEREKGKWQVLTQKQNKPLTLPGLHPNYIKDLLESLDISSKPSKTALIVDCVLGLPQEVLPHQEVTIDSLWKIFTEAAAFKLKEKEFGREVAEKFFEQIAPQAEKFPRRVCEVWSHSNSVFRSRPFQKNIQTGTFRFWKELGRVQDPWLHIWPYPQKTKNRAQIPWMFEGYPSLIWRDYLGLPHRNPRELKKSLKKLDLGAQMDTWKQVEAYPDLADACVLVWGAIHLQNLSQLLHPSRRFSFEKAAQQEGWIMGLKTPREV